MLLVFVEPLPGSSFLLAMASIDILEGNDTLTVVFFDSEVRAVDLDNFVRSNHSFLEFLSLLP